MDLYNNGDLPLSPRSQNLDLPLPVSSSPVQDIHTDPMQSLTTPLDQSENPSSQPLHVDSVADVHAMADPELLACNITSSFEAMQKSKTEKTKDSNEKSEAAADFECNICYEVVKDPVVTCCGHLFCWPCLYRWLHVHCKINKTCPVCKEKVSESGVVPIYGRGSSEGNKEEKSGGLKIPPRPNRIEISKRQQQQLMFVRRTIRHLLHEGSLVRAELQRRVLLPEECLVMHSLPLRSDDESVGIASVGIASADNRHDSEPVRSQTSGSSILQRANAAHVFDASVEPDTTGDLQRNSDAEDVSVGPNRTTFSMTSSTTNIVDRRRTRSMTAMDNVQRQRRRLD